MSECKKWKKKKAMDSKHFTLAINTFNDTSMVTKLVKHYSPSPSLSAIYIIWHNTAARPPEDWVVDLQQVASHGVRVEVVPMESDTLNNRWRPLPRLTTPLVLTLDDDTYLEELQDLEFAFRVAKQNPQQLAGTYPRCVRVSKCS